MPLNLENIETKFITCNNSQFLLDIKKFKVPTPEKELELFELAKKGDKNAKDELFLGHQRFIYAMAKQYATNGDELLDYVSEGNIGLSIAFETFNPTVGVRFITYASHYIRREMHTYLNKIKPIVRQTNKCKYKSKINIIKKEYFNQYGEYPTDDEIIWKLKEKYNLKVKNKCDIYDVNFDSINIDKDDDNYNSDVKLSYDTKTSSYNDYENEIEYESIKKEVAIILSNVSKRDADIIKMIFGIGYDRQFNADEIAEKYNLKTSSINILKNKILEKLKNKVLYYNVA